MKFIKFEIWSTIAIDGHLLMTERLEERDKAEPREEKEDEGCDVQFF